MPIISNQIDFESFTAFCYQFVIEIRSHIFKKSPLLMTSPANLERKSVDELFCVQVKKKLK